MIPLVGPNTVQSSRHSEWLEKKEKKCMCVHGVHAPVMAKRSHGLQEAFEHLSALVGYHLLSQKARKFPGPLADGV